MNVGILEVWHHTYTTFARNNEDIGSYAGRKWDECIVLWLLKITIHNLNEVNWTTVTAFGRKTMFLFCFLFFFATGLSIIKTRHHNVAVENYVLIAYVKKNIFNRIKCAHLALKIWNKVIIFIIETGCLDQAAWSSSSHLTSSRGENYWQLCLMLRIKWLTEVQLDTSVLVTHFKLLWQRKRMTEERAEGSKTNRAQLVSEAAG